MPVGGSRFSQSRVPERARRSPTGGHVAEQLRDAHAEPDVSFIVTPVAGEVHFMRGHDGWCCRPLRWSVGACGCGGSLGWTLSD